MANVKIVKHLSEPWFSLVAAGRKTSEGRLNKCYYADLQRSDRIIFYNGEGSDRREVVVEVVGTMRYEGFAQMIVGEGLKAVLPLDEVVTLDDGVAVYRQFYSEATEQEHGVIAIRIQVVGAG
jgi:ASC-1-like (ASCH) protein